jgi:hypothetical protein
MQRRMLGNEREENSGDVTSVSYVATLSLIIGKVATWQKNTLRNGGKPKT